MTHHGLVLRWLLSFTFLPSPDPVTFNLDLAIMSLLNIPELLLCYIPGVINTILTLPRPVTFLSHPLFPMRPFQNGRFLDGSLHVQTPLHFPNLAFYISNLTLLLLFSE